MTITQRIANQKETIRLLQVQMRYASSETYPALSAQYIKELDELERLEIEHDAERFGGAK